MVYSLLSGPMVYSLFPCMVVASTLFSLILGSNLEISLENVVFFLPPIRSISGKPKKVRFVTFGEGVRNDFRKPLLKWFCIAFTSKSGFRNSFRTPSPKVREFHFLWFGLPEPLLIPMLALRRSNVTPGLKRVFVPRGPKDQKKIEISSEIENFERECNFRANHTPRP